MPIHEPPPRYNQGDPYNQEPRLRKSVPLSAALSETAFRNLARLIVSLLVAAAAKYGVNLDEDAENLLVTTIMLLLPVALAVLQRWKQPLSTDAAGAGREDVELRDGKSKVVKPETY